MNLSGKDTIKTNREHQRTNFFSMEYGSYFIFEIQGIKDDYFLCNFDIFFFKMQCWGLLKLTPRDLNVLLSFSKIARRTKDSI